MRKTAGIPAAVVRGLDLAGEGIGAGAGHAAPSAICSARSEDSRAWPDESKDERVNRELIELLNELRVALPGVQVLFAFLLTVPFSNGWRRITEFQKDVFVAACSAPPSRPALLIAPSAHHRLLFRDQDKERLLFTANRLAIVGIGFLALAMSATILLVIDVVYDETWAAAIAAVAAGFFAWLWFGLPLLRRRRLDD